MRSASSSSDQSVPRSTSKRSRSRSTPESAIFSLTRILNCSVSTPGPAFVGSGGGRDARLEEDPLRGADAGAVLHLAAELVEHHLEPGQRGEDVERAEVAAVRDAQDAALQLLLAAVGGDAEPPQGAGDL